MHRHWFGVMVVVAAGFGAACGSDGGDEDGDGNESADGDTGADGSSEDGASEDGTAGDGSAGGDGAGDGSESGDGSGGGDCSASLVPDNTTGGCNIRLVTPAACETIDLSNGQVYEFAWTTDGTNCETPWTLQIAGDPLSEQNLVSGDFSTDVNAGITSMGGIVYISAQDVSILTSTSGLYHWTVSGFYGSYPASNAFYIKR